MTEVQIGSEFFVDFRRKVVRGKVVLPRMRKVDGIHLDKESADNLQRDLEKLCRTLPPQYLEVNWADILPFVLFTQRFFTKKLISLLANWQEWNMERLE